MSELPVPAVPPPEMPQAQTLVCANCRAPLNGEFCSACGQRHEPHIHTVAHFAGEAFESISHADSRLWQTLWYLFARPGFLTKEFFSGRRAAYLPPFRLYLVLSVIFFVVLGLGGGDAGDGSNATIDQPQTAEDLAAVSELAGQFASQEAAPKPKDANGNDIDVLAGKEVQSGIEDFCEGFVESTGRDQAATTKQKSVLRWCRKYGVEGFGAVGETLAHNIPKAMFVFLPLLALCMKLIYWRPKRYYVEHLLFMVHNHAFVFLVTATVMLIGLIPVVGDYASPLYWAAFFYMAWYIYRAMRNVYHQGRGLTIVKYLTMGYAYILAGAMIFLLTFIYSTITF